MSDQPVTVRLVQRQDYRFDNDFGPGIAVLASDEPAPLGAGTGPSPQQLLGAAVGNCLSASLLFALRKFKQAPEPLGCEVDVATGRNAQGRLRISGMQVRLTLGVPASALEHLDRALAGFEAFCTVTESVRQGIPVDVAVFDATGARLK